MATSIQYYLNETSNVSISTTSTHSTKSTIHYYTSDIHKTNDKEYPWMTNSMIVYVGCAAVLLVCGFCICVLVRCVTKRNTNTSTKNKDNGGLESSLLNSNEPQNTEAVTVKMDLKARDNMEHKNVELANIEEDKSLKSNTPLLPKKGTANMSNVDKLAMILNKNKTIRTSVPIIEETESKRNGDDEKYPTSTPIRMISSGIDAKLNQKTTTNVNNAKSKRKKRSRKKFDV